MCWTIGHASCGILVALIHQVISSTAYHPCLLEQVPHFVLPLKMNSWFLNNLSFLTIGDKDQSEPTSRIFLRFGQFGWWQSILPKISTAWNSDPNDIREPFWDERYSCMLLLWACNIAWLCNTAVHDNSNINERHFGVAIRVSIIWIIVSLNQLGYSKIENRIIINDLKNFKGLRINLL